MTAWLILVPAALLLTAALAIIVLQWWRPNFGFAWLIAMLTALAAWALTLFLRLRLPSELVLADWQPQELFPSRFALTIDRFSWPYAAALAALVLAVIMTESARSQYQAHPLNWAGSLGLGAASLLAVLSGNPFTLAVAWTAVDLVELVVLLSGGSARQLSQRIVLAFTARLLGTFLLVGAIVSTPLPGDTFELLNLTPQAGLLLLLASGLRLGVLPLHLPFSQEPRLRRGMGTVLRLAPAASSLVLLARLPQGILPPEWAGGLTALAALAALYSAARWLAAEDELSGRPYWLVSLAAIAIACVINGQPLSSLAWGVAMLLSGGLIFLYSNRRRSLIFLPLLGLWGLSGLPFSPSAGGWQGISPLGAPAGANSFGISAGAPGTGFSFWLLLVAAAHLLLMLGYARQALKPTSVLVTIERWVVVVYPAGLLLLGVMAVVIGIWGWPGSRTLGVWWLGLSSTAAAGLAGLVYWRWPQMTQRLKLPSLPWLAAVIKGVLSFLSVVLRLDWLYRSFWFLYSLLGRLISIASAMLEGDGGVLWALLLLALLASLVGRGGF